MRKKRTTITLWIIAFFITLFSAVYQRLTGPTYPKSGELSISGLTLKYKLLRSHNTGRDYTIKISNPDQLLSGKLYFKRYKTTDRWTIQEMREKGKFLIGRLPYQPAGGKMIYKIVVADSLTMKTIPADEPVIIRFKGEVPSFIIIPHILIMFAAMLFSNRCGLEALRKKPNTRILVFLTVASLLLGGMVLGPIMQKYAFGMYWSGFPLGEDLTDSKTLIAMIAWIIAFIQTIRGRSARLYILSASIITLAIFFIPHSLKGTELDYAKINTTLPH
jgi:hypothetical protein